MLVLIGHGAGEGAETRISIPGPDLDATDFARLLAAFPTQRVAFINLTSASGDMIPVVAGANRVVITATKTAFERNESHFGQYFVEAFTKDGADADKDGRVSLLEAFRYAALETKRFYDTGGPHADRARAARGRRGDGGERRADGTRPATAPSRGASSSTRGDAATLAAGNDPKLSALYAEEYALQEQVEQVRSSKGTDRRRTRTTRRWSRC